MLNVSCLKFMLHVFILIQRVLMDLLAMTHTVIYGNLRRREKREGDNVVPDLLA